MSSLSFCPVSGAVVTFVVLLGSDRAGDLRDCSGAGAGGAGCCWYRWRRCVGCRSAGAAGVAAPVPAASGPGAPPRRVTLGAQEGDGGLEVLEGVEGLVDGGEAQVGDLVELAQRLEDGQADLVRVDLGAAPGCGCVSSTRWARRARSSSVTGRPWQALRTPTSTLARLNGSVAPERLTTVRLAVSTVVNRRPHSGHWRRRRMLEPSSVARESMTRESVWRQNGQCMWTPFRGGSARACGRAGGQWC